EKTMKQFGAERPSTAGVVTGASSHRSGPASSEGLISPDEWAKQRPLRKLFINQMQDMYYAEQQLVDTLPKLRDKASHPELARAFDSHLAETRGHVERLEASFRL